MMLAELYSPSILDSFLDGGPFMLLTLPFGLVWIWITLSFLRGAFVNAGWVLFIFPLGFTILATWQWLLHWHFVYRELAEGVGHDPMAFAEDALVASRATGWILIAATLSFLSATVLNIWAAKRKRLES